MSDTDGDWATQAAFLDPLVPIDATVVLTVSHPSYPESPSGSFSCRLAARSGSAASPVVISSASILPFATGSVDCIVFPGTLDDLPGGTARPVLLREAHRVLAGNGVMVLHGENRADMHGWTGRLRSRARRRSAAPPGYRGWRNLMVAAGFRNPAGYTVPHMAGNSAVLISMSRAASSAYYDQAFRRRRGGWWNPVYNVIGMLVRSGLIRFLEPSFIFVARK
jgi:SAM-dependent methyltransferase